MLCISRLFIMYRHIVFFGNARCLVYSIDNWTAVTAAKQSYNSVFVNSRERRKSWVILKNWKYWFCIENPYSYPEFSIEDPGDGTENALSRYLEKKEKNEIGSRRLGSWLFPTFNRFLRLKSYNHVSRKFIHYFLRNLYNVENSQRWHGGKINHAFKSRSGLVPKCNRL